MNPYLACYLRQKRAAAESPVIDYALGIPLAPVAPIAGPIGEIAGLVNDPNWKSKQRADFNTAFSLAPGVAAFKRGNRVRQTVHEANDAGGHGTSNAASEYVGTAVSGAMVLPMIAAAVVAAAKPKRSKAEQMAHDSQSNTLMNLIPGVGAYNYMKRQGAAENYGG